LPGEAMLRNASTRAPGLRACDPTLAMQVPG
jgi:hypothetical protein